VKTPAHPHRRTAGFTLIEVLLAAVVIVLAIASSQAVFTTASAKVAYADDSLSARQLAREIRQMAQMLPRESVGSTVVTDAADVVALGSLQGASFSPPIMADGTELSGLTNWEQRIELEVVTLDAPGTRQLTDPRTALSVTSACLYRLKVKILQNDVEVDSFQWWLRL
jgi:prepilin-type N-terminal cleavage/methylation domain-containing protein